MAEVVMIMGESGSGKSASLRNFEPGEVCVLNVAGKKLPFRNQFGRNVIDNADYGTIVRAVRCSRWSRYVVDDAQYLMAFEAFRRAQEQGWNKYVEMAQNFYQLLRDCEQATLTIKNPNGTYTNTGKPLKNTIVYFLQHVDRDEQGIVKPKTQGRMIDEKLNLAGLFTTVLMAQTDGKDYWFQTRNDGGSVVKSPMGMFSEAQIPNDLKFVDTVIREYYGMEREDHFNVQTK